MTQPAKQHSFLSGFQQWILFSIFIGFAQQLGILEHQGWLKYLLYAVGTALWYMIIGFAIGRVYLRFKRNRASEQNLGRHNSQQDDKKY